MLIGQLGFVTLFGDCPNIFIGILFKAVESSSGEYLGGETFYRFFGCFCEGKIFRIIESMKRFHKSRVLKVLWRLAAMNITILGGLDDSSHSIQFEINTRTTRIS